MKVKALEEVTTINPERHWNVGDVADLDDNVALSLIATGKFENAEEPIIEEEIDEDIKPKRSKKNKISN